MTYRAIIFDLDGTLLDTLQDIADSTNAGLASLGFPTHKTNEYRYFVGEGTDVLALRALPEDRRDPATVSKLVARIAEEYSRRWDKNTRPFPGIPELLDGLTSLGIRLAVLTNKRQSFAEMTATKLLPNWRFEVIIGASPSVSKKPDPTGALKIANQMKLKSAEFVYLGDSAIDMKTAVSAGMYPVGALWGFRTQRELLESGAKMLAKKPQDVLKLFG